LNGNIELRRRQSLPQRLITHLEICSARSVQECVILSSQKTPD
jgi:hypothetical protein